MKKSKFFLMGATMALVLGLMVGSCATYSTRDGVTTPLGSLTSVSINKTRTVVAEYSIILGLITSGYESFLEATKGKDVDIIDASYFGFFRKVQAVERE